MAIRIDPAGDELRILNQAANWRGKRVLEIGCGDGRLTLRLAALHPQAIEALDPAEKLIRTARKNLPARYAGKVRYHTGTAGKLKYPANSFDIVVFSWVL
jgi:ubiquinone/menaquinone biosynthesis C-methylase UbiE